MGLPRPWDQQWSLRLQQVLAYETDLLEFEDIFDGSKVIEAKVRELADGAREQLKRIELAGGAASALEMMKAALVESNRARTEAIESGEQKVVGVNVFTDGEPSPLGSGRQAHSHRRFLGRGRTDRAAESVARRARATPPWRTQRSQRSKPMRAPTRTSCRRRLRRRRRA